MKSTLLIILVALAAPVIGQTSLPPYTGTGTPGDAFGQSVVAGDFDGDGLTDVAIGKPQATFGTVPTCGAVEMRMGDGTTRTIGSLDSLGNFVGNGGGAFGWSLAAGDLDQNGKDELVVGAPAEGSSPPLYGGQHYVFNDLDYVASTGVWVSRYVAGTNQAQTKLGWSVTVLPHPAGVPGSMAWAAGSPDGAQINGGARRGYVDVYDGATGAFITSVGPTETTPAPPLGRMKFGSQIVGGDFDGDGLGDLAVNGYNQLVSSAYRLIWVLRSGWPQYYYAITTNGMMDGVIVGGAGLLSLAMPGDVNGDGVDDLMWADPSQFSNPLDPSGSVFFRNCLAGQWAFRER
ncbi:MAG: FG-GAP repeat protein [Planctomycetota bacterium]